TTTLLSQSTIGPSEGNGISANGIISSDGRVVAFQSFASNLIQGDQNGRSDVFYAVLAPGGILAPRLDVIPSPTAVASMPVWPIASGYGYGVEYKTVLGDTAWKDVTQPISHNGSNASVSDQPGAQDSQRFYRLRINPQP